MVHYPDLIGLVMHYLGQHKTVGMLSWHSGALPKEEIWIKICDDHGGGSFKLSFQIANTLHPNAVRSTVPFLVFSAPDSVDNFATAIKPYTAQIQQLQHLMWEGKSVRCTFGDDYELICACYGLSGVVENGHVFTAISQRLIISSHWQNNRLV